jgi:hypothetical protein
MKHVDTMRIFSSPMDFTLRGEMKNDAALMFFETCLIELYLHGVIDGLKKLKSVAIEYTGEFECNRRYYAAAKRMDSIREYGGEPDDYDDEDNIVPATDEMLKSYGPVSDIRPDCRDIFMSAELPDLTRLFTTIAVDSRMDINDFFGSMTGGKRLKTYRMEEGKMVENDWADDAVMKAEREVAGDELSAILMRALCCITELVMEVNSLNPEEENRDFFMSLPSRVDRIFELDFCK